MNNEADRNTKNDVWPPPPTFRPDTAKPTRQTVPLWISMAINAGLTLIYCVFRVWHLWHTHRKIDWFWDVAFMGLMLFTMTTAASLWVIPWVRRKTET